MLQVERLILGELSTNCYLVYSPESEEALIIDPADSGDAITDRLLQLQLHPTAVLLTHGHFDHLLGLLELRLNFDIPILMHRADLFLLQRARSSAAHFIKRQVDPIPIPDEFVTQDYSITIGRNQLTVMETPGHTPGSICLYNEYMVFSGDTLFQGSVGRTNLKYANPLKLSESLHHLFALPLDTIVFPGHGESTTIQQEKKLLTIN